MIGASTVPQSRFFNERQCVFGYQASHLLFMCLLHLTFSSDTNLARELDAKFQIADSCNRELNLELEQMKEHSENLHVALQTARAEESRARHDLEISVRNHQLEVDALIRQAQDGAAKFTSTVSETVNQRVAPLNRKIDELNQEIASLSLVRDERDAAIAKAADFQRMFFEEQRKSQRYLSQQVPLQEKLSLLTDDVGALRMQIASMSLELEKAIDLEKKTRLERDSAVASAAECKRVLLEEQRTSQVTTKYVYDGTCCNSRSTFLVTHCR